jgi:hypothetical protein
VASFIGEVANFNSKAFDASLYRTTAYAREKSSVELSVGGQAVYLENPQTLEEKKDYIRYKFGDNYQLACAVAYGEGLRSNGTNSSPVEYSVGTFQINLAEDYGHGSKVHWDKVGGNNLDEKEAWLQVPKNNIDLAFVMSSGGEDFNQWGAFSDGSYLEYLGDCL